MDNLLDDIGCCHLYKKAHLPIRQTGSCGIHNMFFKLQADADPVLDREVEVLSLGAVAQCRVVYFYLVTHRIKCMCEFTGYLSCPGQMLRGVP